MAENSVSQVSFGVNERDEIHFLSIGSMPAVLSTEVVRHFQRRHSHVLRDVDRLCSILPKSFREPNFGLTFKIIPAPMEQAVRKRPIFSPAMRYPFW